MALATNLVAYYKLDGNSNDSVSTNNGTDTAVTYSLANGKINQGAGFNGTTSQISLPNLGISGSTARTISLWLNSNDISNIRYLTGWGPESGSFEDTCAIFSGVSSGNIYWSFDTNDYYTSSIISIGTWSHIVCIYDGGTLSTSTVHIYKDGTPQSLTKAGIGTGAANTTDSDYAIGYDKIVTGRNLNGDIDEIGIWSRALTQTEVTELYNSGAGLQYPFTPPVTAHPSFLLNFLS